MKPLRLLTLVILLPWATPALAALDADLVLVYGNSWRRALPTYAAAAKAPKKGSGALASLPPVVLWSEGEEAWTKELVQRLAPKKTVVVAPPGSPEIPFPIPGKVQKIEAPNDRLGLALAEAAFSPKDAPPSIYVSEAEVGSALVASALAAADRAPLLVATADLARTLHQAGVLAERLGAKEVVMVGGGDQAKLSSQSGTKVRVLKRQEALRAYNAKAASANHLVAVAPADASGPFSPPRLSVGSIPYLLAKGAAFTYVGDGPGKGASPEQATELLEAEGLGPFHFITLIGDHLAIPMREVRDVDQEWRGVENPRVHKVPPFVSVEGAPSDRAVGRLAALDVFDLSRWIARLIHPAARPDDGEGVLVFANADEKFILGETISRTTSAELANAGVQVESLYRDEITPERIQRELPGHSLVLWEGHPRDLTLDDDALPAPEAPLPPASFFLQGCYTLDRSDPYVLVERGANAVLGTYMAVYSSSGSGFARAYLNAQLHAGATAGEAMARARNYLLSVVELKKRRGHEDWRKTLRAALSFDLWGDPTAPLGVESRAPRRQPVTSRLVRDRLTVRIPSNRLPTASAGPYQATIRPGAELAGLYNFEEDDKRRLSELFYVEVKVPESFGPAPKLQGALPDETYAWIFSPRTRTLSVLVHETALPTHGAGTLSFQLVAEDSTSAAP